MPIWTNLRVIVRREYFQAVGSRWFLLATIGAPLLFIGMGVAAGWLAAGGTDPARSSSPSMSIADGTGVLYPRLAAQFDALGYDVEPVTWHADLVGEINGHLEDGNTSGFIVLQPDAVESGEAILYANSRPSLLRRTVIRDTLTEAMARDRLATRGLDPETLIAGMDLRIETIESQDADRQATDVSETLAPFAFIPGFLLLLVLFVYGVRVMTATIEEKANRVVEVIVSCVPPWHLMLGKIIGVGAVGLTQLAIWITLIALVAGAGIAAITPSLSENDLAALATMLDLVTGLSAVWFGLLFLGLFLFGYFMFASMYAALGAMCTTPQETGQAGFVVNLLAISPLILLNPVAANPDSATAEILSLVPFFTPVLIWPRLAVGAVAPWQLAVAFVLMGLTAVALAWAAGRIYRTGILMTGKRATLPEVWRWLRQA